MDPILSLRGRAHVALRALATVAGADGELHSEEHRMIEHLADAMDVSVDVATLEPIAPDELATALTDDVARRALVQQMVVLTTLDGEITEDEVARVEAFASALGVAERGVRTIRDIAEGRPRRAAFALARRSFMPGLLARIWRERGLRGIWQLVRAALGGRDAQQEARFAALAQLPSGTLGRELHDHFVANAFPFPGQRKGAPDFMLFHDLGHLLGGYGTTPDQELLVAGFQAGYMKGDGLAMYLIIAMLFQLAIEPLARLRGVEPRKGQLDVVAFMQAVERGRAMKTSLVGWDPWLHVARPLAEVQAELGVAAAPC
jgi:uncharacterized tellurite resistance protein B-like protein